MKPTLYLYRGEPFQPDETRPELFVKDVVGEGRWIHPSDGQVVDFPADRLQSLIADTNRWMAEGNRVPLTDGHSLKAADELGDWRGGFTVLDGKAYGVCEPRDKVALAKIRDGVSTTVSIGTAVNLKGQKSGRTYDEVIQHIALTPVPVVDGQEGFVALSKKLDTTDRECFVHEALALSLQGGTDMDPKKFAKALGLKEDATEKEILDALAKKGKDGPTEADITKKVLDGLSLSLKDHGVTLDTAADGTVVVKKADPKQDDEPAKTAREKELEAKVAELQADTAKAAILAGQKELEAAVADHRVPPAIKAHLEKLLAAKGKFTGQMLSADQNSLIPATIDVTETILAMLKDMPKQVGSTGSQLSVLGAKSEEEKKKETQLSQEVDEIVGRVQPKKKKETAA